jgi:hypothetical protein
MIGYVTLILLLDPLFCAFSWLFRVHIHESIQGDFAPITNTLNTDSQRIQKLSRCVGGKHATDVKIPSHTPTGAAAKHVW